MTITSAIVLFAVIWALVFFLVLPFGQVSQHEVEHCPADCNLFTTKHHLSHSHAVLPC